MDEIDILSVALLVVALGMIVLAWAIWKAACHLARYIGRLEFAIYLHGKEVHSLMTTTDQALQDLKQLILDLKASGVTLGTAVVDGLKALTDVLNKLASSNGAADVIEEQVAAGREVIAQITDAAKQFEDAAQAAEGTIGNVPAPPGDPGQPPTP